MQLSFEHMDLNLSTAASVVRRSIRRIAEHVCTRACEGPVPVSEEKSLQGPAKYISLPKPLVGKVIDILLKELVRLSVPLQASLEHS